MRFNYVYTEILRIEWQRKKLATIWRPFILFPFCVPYLLYHLSIIHCLLSIIITQYGIVKAYAGIEEMHI